MKFWEEKTKIKLNLKNGRFYTGFIKEFPDDSTFVFIDKFGAEVTMDLNAISYVELANNNDIRKEVKKDGDTEKTTER